MRYFFLQFWTFFGPIKWKPLLRCFQTWDVTLAAPFCSVRYISAWLSTNSMPGRADTKIVMMICVVNCYDKSRYMILIYISWSDRFIENFLTSNYWEHNKWQRFPLHPNKDMRDLYFKCPRWFKGFISGMSRQCDILKT